MKLISAAILAIKAYLIGGYFEVVLWLDKRKTENKIESYGLPKVANRILINAVQAQYQEGVSRIKEQVNSLVKTKDAKEYDKVLKTITDLLNTAKTEANLAQEKEIEALRKSLVRGSKDIRTDVQKAKMIEKRILDYYELQRYNKIRELHKKIRAAEKVGNFVEAEKLKKEWVALNGRYR